MFTSMKSIEEAAASSNKPIWELIMKDDAFDEGISENTSFEQMKKMYLAMKDSVNHYDKNLKSMSGLSGTDAYKIHLGIEQNNLVSGTFIANVIEKALMVAESNACMKRIVASPTAGSCGVVPAVLISYQNEKDESDDTLAKALYVAAGIGGVIAAKASLSGAEGGCQAEIGSASAMAAGALTFLRGGNPHQIFEASGIALKGLLGLVCDPVAGLVEVPCVKRNVIGAVNAITASDMAICGIESQIPPDEVVDAMKSVGKMMSPALRETGEGGLAATITGQKIAKRLKEQ